MTKDDVIPKLNGSTRAAAVFDLFARFAPLEPTENYERFCFRRSPELARVRCEVQRVKAVLA